VNAEHDFLSLPLRRGSDATIKTSETAKTLLKFDIRRLGGDIDRCGARMPLSHHCAK
jgi:hypothetical protein